MTLSGQDFFAAPGISVSLFAITGAGVSGSIINSGNTNIGLRTYLAMQYEGK